MTDAQKKITPDWLSAPHVKEVMAALEGAGFEAYFVGGCVRNALLSAPNTDIDIATNAHPEAVMALGEAHGFKTLPTGIEHGTVSWVLDGAVFQITTYRRDIKTDGRHAQVAFADTILEDAARRDFTMNALYADSTGTVFDPLKSNTASGGLVDLQNRRVRFIGNASARIAEDALRILRFFRMSALYGADKNGVYELDAEGLAACGQAAAKLKNLSRERIYAELSRLLAAPDPTLALNEMQSLGILQQIIKGAEAGAFALLIKLEKEMEFAPDWIMRLVALGGTNIKDSLPLTRAEKKISDGIQNALESNAPPHALGYYYGMRIARAATIINVIINAADKKQELNKTTLEQIELGAAQQKKYPLRGDDLAKSASGRALGELLKKGEQAWVDSHFTKTKDELLQELT